MISNINVMNLRDVVSLRHTSGGVSCGGLLGRSVVPVLDVTGSSSGVSAVCGVFTALSSPGKH